MEGKDCRGLQGGAPAGWIPCKGGSEGRPDIFTYGRTQADGANMLADILKPFGGLLKIWRCFVYSRTAGLAGITRQTEREPGMTILLRWTGTIMRM